MKLKLMKNSVYLLRISRNLFVWLNIKGEFFMSDCSEESACLHDRDDVEIIVCWLHLIIVSLR